MYDLPKVAKHEQLVSWEAKRQYKGELLLGALSVEMTFYRPIQKSGTIKEKQGKRDGLLRPIVTPDVSNYVKLVEDALNGIVYKDDSQIVELIARKYYSDDPRTEIIISEV